MATSGHQIAAVLIVAMLGCATALAVEPDEILTDSALEVRARNISAELRCLVCQNQSIDDSNAPLARDLRLLVRDRLKAGDSDDEVRTYIVARYGEFVLLQPPLNIRTLLLWLAPLLVLLAALTIAIRVFARRAPSPSPTGASALTGAEEEKLRGLLADAEKRNDN